MRSGQKYSDKIRPVFDLIQDNSDIKIECFNEDKLRNERICNVSAPFMRGKTQVRSHNTAHKSLYVRKVVPL